MSENEDKEELGAGSEEIADEGMAGTNETETAEEAPDNAEVADEAGPERGAAEAKNSARLSGKKFFPHHVLALSVGMVFVLVFCVYMAQTYPIPDDAPLEIPFPDDGENVPGPEWLFLLFWLPFWYFKGMMKKYLVFTALVPIAVAIFLVFLPYFHKLPINRIPGLNGILSRIRGMESGFNKSFLYAIFPLLFFTVIGIAMYKSGHQAKTLGCDSCHNPAMGHRMAVPPVDVFGYYSVDRARQIGIGKYRAGKSSGVTESGDQIYAGADEGGYKDADWQMRHMYEPTFTW